MKVNNLRRDGNNYILNINSNDYVVNEDLIVKYRLLPDKEIDENILEEIILQNNNMKLYMKCVKLINTKLRSTTEIRKYLLKQNLELSDANYLVNELISNKLLDDKKYAIAFINDRVNLSTDGYYKIKKHLVSLKIDEELWIEYLDEIPMSVWQEKCNKLISKKMKTLKPASINQTKKKLEQYLINLGFGKETISESISTIEFDNDLLLNAFINKNKNKSTEKIIASAQRNGFNYYDIKRVLEEGNDKVD